MRIKAALLIALLVATTAAHSSLREEEDDADDIYSARYAKNKAAMAEASKSPIDEVVDSMKPFMPASVHDRVKKFDVEAKLTRFNSYLRDLIKEINLMGVPDPLDHIVFVFVFWFGIYVPTKLAYTFLDLFYGSSSENGIAPPPSEDSSS